MAVNNVHPLFAEFLVDWTTMRDTYRGERIVKAAGEVYLPSTAGMKADGMAKGQPGQLAYEAYKLRAVFHDLVADGVRAMLGTMWSKPPTIELPAAMEFMRERASLRGEPLELVLRRINEQQLVSGRVGLLADMPAQPIPDQPPMPYLVTYEAETILNWDEGAPDQLSLPKLNLVVLNESTYERQMDFTWRYTQIYRVLVLGDVLKDEESGVYQQGLFTSTEGETGLEFNPSALSAPSIRGNTLQELPFVIINSSDIVPTPADPPLLGLANLALAIYRGEADYRQNLFMTGQDTLVIMGSQNEDDVTRVGAGSVINLPLNGDAKYVGVSGTGLSEQRSALENDLKEAKNRAGQLIDTTSSMKESGEALHIRVAAQTVTLHQIALAGAAGLQQVLRSVATWMGLDPLTVTITPNLEFSDTPLVPDDMVKVMTAKSMGLPLSKESIHDKLVDKGWTQMSFEDEQAAIEEEPPMPSDGTGAGGAPGSGGGDGNQDPSNNVGAGGD
jgi:hypothetical protein